MKNFEDKIFKRIEKLKKKQEKIDNSIIYPYKNPKIHD